jgi:hypothetical protein
LAQYRFTLQALDTIHLPPLKGSALRGGFGHTFKGLVCTQPHLCQKSCRRGNVCPYGYIFETAPPDNSQALSNLSDVPRPFIIRGTADRRTRIPAGESLDFEVTLIGHGINFLPYFIAIFQQLGRRGLGHQRGQYRLSTVEAVSPLTGQTALIYRSDEELLQIVDFTVTTESITNHAAELSQSLISQSPNLQSPISNPQFSILNSFPTLTLKFLSPTRLKHQDRWVNSGPEFSVLVSKLLSRISSLSYFHCGRQFEADFRELIDRAANVTIVASQTYWEDWSRFSGRQKQWIKMGGLVGQVTYQGNWYDYLPLLTLGELIHVGKGTVFGNGQYEIVTSDAFWSQKL